MGEAAWKLDEESYGDIVAGTRRYPRANVYLSVDVFSGHNFWTGLTMNLSESGVFIATDNALPAVGSMVVLSFALPFENDSVVALAEVRWTRSSESDDEAPQGIGLEFVDLSDTLLEKISTFVTIVREPLDFEA